ncbi:MAG: RidA family protein [Pseudomonadota bacterium]
MPAKVIHTDAAPAAIGPYSQAIQAGDTVYLSGQIPLDPATGELVPGDFAAQAEQAFANLRAVASAAGGDLSNVVKLNIYLIDLGNFAAVNDVMQRFFSAPFPARAALGVAALPKGAQVEVDGVLVL